MPTVYVLGTEKKYMAGFVPCVPIEFFSLGTSKPGVYVIVPLVPDVPTNSNKIYSDIKLNPKTIIRAFRNIILDFSG